MLNFDHYDIQRTERTGYPYKPQIKASYCDICGCEIFTDSDKLGIENILACDDINCRQEAVFEYVNKDLLLEFINAYNLEHELIEFVTT